MAKLLYIEASPRKERSYSIAVAKAFLAAYQSANPGDTIETLDLWKTRLPDFDEATINAKYQVMSGQAPTDADAQAWQTITDHCQHFASADKYLLGVPMWNFGIPYKLKHYVDVITQPGQTFRVNSAGGYEGLVQGKTAVIYAQGGSYEGDAGQSLDFQKRYMSLWLGFIGLTDVTNIMVAPTANPGQSSQAKATAVAAATSLAAQF